MARKTALRDQLLTRRGRIGLPELGSLARSLAQVVTEVPEVRSAATVALYVSIGTEPGTGPLIDELDAAGKRILLPCLLPDNDLDWAAYDGDLVRAPRGLLEPSGERLGVSAVAGADVVLVPGLAVDDHGHRMGRGGGSYDRILARVPAGTLTCALLYPWEIGVPVPVEAHDRAVSAAASAEGMQRFS
ncbi:5-formyltetrahydrofolate cyclo-ligase [Nocardioides luteus]|uniref:5-formyltetrahydrofolate cyclo-ligase n=1 Tax=Nocardioides luteus TaxID=1844 RepID=A0ABQ5SYF8_9ACTN|nr:5-formyltetrahydrofolate cyclo-ligase [Nocardioides luteus]MDR7313595.1 5-formyltetrahydrofolate cyclo-ligase [Nocardioides luteus]GGR69122.1 5-formyltetrahydrofolate cyclo-ligase [Nocardioides luteus]GLJ69217.1 5-formyltetrahydrofolate cyclo-ligase [Nocardioides luteus]